MAAFGIDRSDVLTEPDQQNLLIADMADVEVTFRDGKISDRHRHLTRKPPLELRW